MLSILCVLASAFLLLSPDAILPLLQQLRASPPPASIDRLLQHSLLVKVKASCHLLHHTELKFRLSCCPQAEDAPGAHRFPSKVKLS